MSTLITDRLSFPVITTHDPPARLHQPNSGPIPAVRWRGWSGWTARLQLRSALRDLAEDKHLLDDLGMLLARIVQQPPLVDRIRIGIGDADMVLEDLGVRGRAVAQHAAGSNGISLRASVPGLSSGIVFEVIE
jgi:uncharacterized protein YjiS (DUF1127 family)